MVNPNDPNSEPDGVFPSEPGSDPSSSESGPISDELFDSLSELLGDSPATDEPASLPDIESWSDESETIAESLSSSVEDSGEILEDPTLIQMPEEEAPLAEEIWAIDDRPSDSSAASEAEDTEAVRADVGDTPVPADPWADESEIPLATSPIDPDLPIDLTPDLGESPDTSLPDLDTVASAEPSDIISDPWADPTPEEPTPIESIGDLDTVASAEPSDIISDPWVDPAPAEPTPIESIGAGLEDQTLIQVPDIQTPSESPAEPPPDSPPAETPMPEPWADVSESSIPEEAVAAGPGSEPDIPTPETAEFSEPALDIPSVTDSIPGSDADVALPDVPSEEGLLADSPGSGEDSLFPEEETPVSIDAPFSSSVESSSVESSSESLSSEDSPPAPEIPPAAEQSAEQESEETPIPPSPESIGASEDIPTGGDVPLSSFPSESSSSPSGALGGKLPLNRYQAVGLLIALSALGTIIYLGVTGNPQDPSLPGPSPSSPALSPGD
ncbi:hypothetical protein [Acaryochloris sp. IP29b_bin.137]|uniref:hypothetical protein n=1 Tax=Acaryochloris sp. IP29b_bin.137 TaxID=2969217 RepID=UPI00260C478B|nr:hypothetical protein [Acaryochloris sp. IP29b_bin.137]